MSPALQLPLRPVAHVLAKMAMRLDPGIVGRLYRSFSVEQRAAFWEALDTSVPEEWARARHDLRRPLVTPSEASEQTIGDSAGGGSISGRWVGSTHIEEVPKREWSSGGR